LLKDTQQRITLLTLLGRNAALKQRRKETEASLKDVSLLCAAAGFVKNVSESSLCIIMAQLLASSLSLACHLYVFRCFSIFPFSVLSKLVV
ncbi:unnamed protein product, partial [Linum tenue]